MLVGIKWLKKKFIGNGTAEVDIASGIVIAVRWHQLSHKDTGKNFYNADFNLMNPEHTCMSKMSCNKH